MKKTLILLFCILTCTFINLKANQSDSIVPITTIDSITSTNSIDTIPHSSLLIPHFSLPIATTNLNNISYTHVLQHLTQQLWLDQKAISQKKRWNSHYAIHSKQSHLANLASAPKLQALLLVILLLLLMLNQSKLFFIINQIKSIYIMWRCNFILTSPFFLCYCLNFVCLYQFIIIDQNVKTIILVFLFV